MTFHALPTIPAVRALLLITLMALGLTAGPHVASADTPDLADDPEGICTVERVDYPVLIGSGYEGHGTPADCGGGLYDSILAGSGYEGHAVVSASDRGSSTADVAQPASQEAQSRSRQASASASPYETVLIGSGYEGHTTEGQVAEHDS